MLVEVSAEIIVDAWKKQGESVQRCVVEFGRCEPDSHMGRKAKETRDFHTQRLNKLEKLGRRAEKIMLDREMALEFGDKPNFGGKIYLDEIEAELVIGTDDPHW